MKVKFMVEGKAIEVQEELVKYFVDSEYLRSSLRRSSTRIDLCVYVGEVLGSTIQTTQLSLKQPILMSM